jgi:parallel beta-helix repeat protein
VNEAGGHRAALIVALLLVGSLVAPLSLSRVASAVDLIVDGSASATEIDVGQSVDFSCDPSDGTAPYYFYWDFGDGAGTSTDQNPSYAFPSAGTFSVTVTVTDDFEGVGSWSADITVNELPSATGTPASATIDAGQNVDFTCTPSGGSESGYTFVWDFGDGLGTSNDQSPSYIYPSAGTFYVTVTVADDLGGSSSPQAISTIRVYDVHDPIVILINGDFTSGNGVVSGSGTIDDPFIIEGWGIDASGAKGIDIENTDAYFTVRDCYVHDGGSGYVGIYLYNCVNGILSDNTCANNYDGIYLEESSGNTVSYNDCSFNSRHGIVLYSSSDSIISNNTLDSNSNIGIFLQQSSDSNTVSNNTCSNANYGICLSSSSGNTVDNNTCSSSYFAGMRLSLSSGNILSNNTCSNNYIGMIIQRSNSNALSNNTCSSNDEYGIYIYASSNSNTLSNNTCSEDYYGIYLYSSSGNDLIDNICSNNYDGIYLYYSDGNTIVNNTCELNVGDYAGICVDSSSSNILVNNTCTYNYEGMYLYNSNDNTISDNNCSSNDYDGIYLVSSSSNEMTRNQLCDNAQYGISIDSGSGSNTIWRNTFIDNNGAGSEYNAANIQAYDDTDNLWYSPGAPHGYGNYWNDWTTPDADSNSIVDSPYTIDGSSVSQDNYPLTIPEYLLTKMIKGQVRDEMDTPIPGAQVSVTIKNGEVVIVTKTTTTDANGYYVVTFDQDEWGIGYTIDVTAEHGEVQWTETIEADGSTAQTVDIQFPFAIAQFGNWLGFLLAGALVGVFAMIFLKRKRIG